LHYVKFTKIVAQNPACSKHILPTNTVDFCNKNKQNTLTKCTCPKVTKKCIYSYHGFHYAMILMILRHSQQLHIKQNYLTKIYHTNKC